MRSLSTERITVVKSTTISVPKLCALALIALGVATAGSLSSSATVAKASALSVRKPRLLAFPCTLQRSCRQRALYKPRLFSPGSHYTLKKVRWTEWTRFGASAHATLYSEFQGEQRHERTTIVFSTPRRMCGVLTFTEWHSGSGDGGAMTKVGRHCFFVIS